MVCPYLEYRESDDRHSFDTERAYCRATERFVQPMRADICNDRYDLVHETDCEIYRAHADEADTGSTDGGTSDGADDGSEGES